MLCHGDPYLDNMLVKDGEHGPELMLLDWEDRKKNNPYGDEAASLSTVGNKQPPPLTLGLFEFVSFCDSVTLSLSISLHVYIYIYIIAIHKIIYTYLCVYM